MYLNKLEIHGFKSFGDAVKLSIPSGITAVIGPNGSGKSNVADAIRWVLGEQSAKTLRGTKMEDIIFAGTEKRKSLGYAEVSMTIINDDRKLPIDYEQVVIKRRVYRSGESEYFINNASCRLKDIQELFMDTGVGKEGYSIIGQGQIDKILSSKPEDRRSLFEEAAGIYKYKIRKQEAERKLERERENLLRINDIMVEIESRLEPLEIEASKTREYLSFKDNLKDLELNIFIEEMDRIKEELDSLKATIENTQSQYQDTLKIKEETTKAYETCKQEREKLFKDLEEILTRISDLEKKQQQNKADIVLNEERITSIDNLILQIEKDTQKQQDYKKTMQSERQVLAAKKTGVELEKTTQEELLQKAELELGQQAEQVRSVMSHVEGSKTQLFDKMRQIDLLKSQIDNQTSLEEQMDYRAGQVKETIQRLNSEISHQEVHLQVLEKKKQKVHEDLVTYEEDFGIHEAKKKELESLITDTRKQADATGQNAVQAERQIKWLEQIKNDHEGYFQSVKQVLNLKASSQQEWKGILGVTAELIEVPKQYEIAMVTALGGAMQNIVTESEKDAKAMISVMKQRGIGKATFLPLDTMQVYKSPQEIEQLRQETGFLGLGNELIAYDAKYEVIAQNLLGRILIVDTIDHASAIARKYRYRYKIVTLEGDVFNAGGSLSGGSSKNNKNNIFARSRELKELEQKYKELLEKEQQLRRNLQGAEVQYAETLEKWNELVACIEKNREEEKALIFEINKSTSTLQITKDSQLQLVEEKIKLEELRIKSLEDKDAIYDQIEALESTINEDQEALKELENNLEELKAIQEQERNQITEKKIALSQTVQNITHIVEQIVALEMKIENTKEQHTSILSRQDELGQDRERIQEHIKSLHEDVQKLDQMIIDAHGLKESQEQNKVHLDQKESQTEEALRSVEEVIEKLKEELYRLDHKNELLELDYQKQNDVIWEQYELTYTACLPFRKDLGDTPSMKKEADKIRSKIRIIGNINVNAVTEFEETRTRFEFLDTQRTDIEKAEKTLMEMIDKLLVQMHDIFREQFQSIATNFSQVFQELFGGGMAFLQLVDEENILESGIEIIAKPPGKKLQNMTLLSGGERTLTAIALLFGILQLKPSPFCVLDEIEAALDDANVLRFAQYLGSLSDETQFVVITHRKGTMECADTLYGVTMQERGVSTVLSIKLEEATQYIEKKLS